jgi:integrase
MAAIRKKGDFQWHVQIRKKGFQPQTRTFDTKAEADLWAKTTESEMGRGLFKDLGEAESTTLGSALETYLTTISVKKDGHDQEKIRIRSWKNDPLAKRSLASLKPSDFAKWLDNRLESVSISTAKKDLAVISHLFTVAEKKWQMPVLNPILKVDMPTEDNSRDRILEDGEEQLILDELKPIRGRSPLMIPLVLFALETACRQSELLALKHEDVNSEKSTARIRGKERKDGKSRTKNREKYRDIPLSSRAKMILNSLPTKEGRVFPISAAVAKNAFIEAIKRTKIENFTFHDLRHAATTRLAEKLALHELMKVTGHSSTRMLARYYHPKAEDLAKKLG